MMSYVLQSPQGELVVIDGGWEGDGPYLKRFLLDHGGRVHTWFITHPHDDHIGALTAILRQPDGLKIDRIYAALLSDAWFKRNDPNELAPAQALNAAGGGRRQNVHGRQAR